MRPIKIKSKREAEIIIREAEDLVKKGQKLTETQKYDYEFAKIFSTDIKKRKEKKRDKIEQI